MTVHVNDFLTLVHQHSTLDSLFRIGLVSDRQCTATKRCHGLKPRAPIQYIPNRLLSGPSARHCVKLVARLKMEDYMATEMQAGTAPAELESLDAYEAWQAKEG